MGSKSEILVALRKLTGGISVRTGVGSAATSIVADLVTDGIVGEWMVSVL